MNADVLEAIALILAAAVMNGVYALPMRLNRQWQWEHSWFAFSILGVAVVPTLITMLTVPNLWSIYPAVSAPTLASMALFGLMWGVSMVFFGLALTLVGVAITFAVALGTSAASGALIPLLTQHPEQLLSSRGLLIAIGIATILIGVGLCGLAGNQRDRILSGSQKPDETGSIRGFIFALISGVLGSMLNLGLAFGGSIQRMAHDQGASAAMMSNAVWLPCLYAGFLPGVIYCLYLMKRNRNTSTLRSGARWYYPLMGACMGLLWFGSIICYSFATVKLGQLGPVIGWPLFLSCVVIASTIAGLLTGEWSKSGPGPRRTMAAGVCCLVVAIGFLSFAGK